MLIGINERNFQAHRNAYPKGRHNGAYYYAKEIEENIVPLIRTDYNWDLLGMRMTKRCDHALVFIHHNIDLDTVYAWLEKLEDIILVVSQKHVFDWAVDRGYRAILLPLSIDVGYVHQFAGKKKYDTCYAGNRWPFKRKSEEAIKKGVDFPPRDLDREALLRFIAPYKKCYAIGRCAMEAKVLGCEILPFYWRYPDPNHWKILDNADAAKMLQEALDMIEADRHSVNCFDFPEYKLL